MPKFVTPMPLVIFRQLKSPGFYPLGGVQGLYLRIRGASESYILRYQDTFGKRRSMSLGLRRSMSLSEARTKATEIRARLSEGINPTPHAQLVGRQRLSNRLWGGARNLDLKVQAL